MKKFKYALFISFSLVLFSCGNKTVSKTDSGDKYKDKKAEIVFENDVKFLIAGKPTRANIITENIDLNRIIIVAPGIALNKNDSDGFLYTITPNEETLVNGQLIIRFREHIENQENFSLTFYVNVKTKSEE